jgi:hypothetical protein
MRPRPALPLALGALALCALAACQAATLPAPPAREGSAPRFRADGERLPAFSGRSPQQRGWVKVDDLLWIDARDLEAYRRGEVFDGREYRPFDRALAAGVAADAGFHLRTDHVALRTNVAWRDAVGLAREADQHVRRLVAAWGETLDLRLPADPLPVVVCRTRAEFDRRLRGAVAGARDWNAFYEAREGAVFVSAEPAPAGALPLLADLRHEMTHQVLDLSRPPHDRGTAFGPGWFWLWEGIAIHAEGLGDEPGREQGRMRLERFHRRLAWDQQVPLPALVALPQAEFEGRHYDQVASVMRYLLVDADPAIRERTMATVAGLLRPGALHSGPAAPPFEAALGLSPQELERAWLRSLGA